MPRRKGSKSIQSTEVTKRKFKAEITSIFINSGFTKIKTEDVDVVFEGLKSEFDAIYLFDNIIVVVEDTTQSANLGDHLRKKAEFYRKIKLNSASFISILQTLFPAFSSYAYSTCFAPVDYKIRFVYCSKTDIEKTHKDANSDVMIFMDYRHVQYFLSLIKTIRKSGKYEIFKFLGLSKRDVGVASAPNNNLELNGFLLPESPSGFASDHFVATFYVDPENLMQLSYVLRRDGWMDRDALYQRLLIPGKIANMRKYLAEQSRVYINNIIVTLPGETKILNENGDQINFGAIERSVVTSVQIKIPNEYNKIGIIDGQHRLFSYHEGSDVFESTISQKRKKQNLLVTGIIFPVGTGDEARLTFESKLFLEINDKQSRVGSALRQDIQAIIHPFEAVSIGKAVISRLAIEGPLKGYLESHFFDKGKTKTSSIVSYGLRQIVNISGEHTLFKLWGYADKEKLKSGDKKVLALYVDFCFQELKNIFNGYKACLEPKGMFVLDTKRSRALSTTALNGVIHCLGNVIEFDNHLYVSEEYVDRFKKLTIDYHPDNFTFKSSHWAALGKVIFVECFR